MAKLIIFEELQNTDTIFETFDLAENRILIGSDLDNHLVLRSPDIDASHASLELRANHWFLQDLGGPGGTSVNGQLIEGPYRLHQDDVIQVGTIKMRFYNDEPGATEEYSLAAIEQEAEGSEAPDSEYHIGRKWFAKVAAITLLIIFFILMFLLGAHAVGLIDVGDLLPGMLF